MERDAEVVTVLVFRGVDRAARVCARGARWLTAVVLIAMVAGAFVTAVAIVRLGFSSWPRAVSTVAVGGAVLVAVRVVVQDLRASGCCPGPGQVEQREG